MRPSSLAAFFLLAVSAAAPLARAQPLGEPDRGQPGDAMIQAYLAAETEKLAAKWADDVVSREAWEKRRPEYVEQYYYMLGLSPRPEKTDLAATVTGTLKGDGYEVDMLHYQSRPKLYVTANLYRPAEMKTGERLPAVLYVCGHSGRGRNGNKVAFQSHGIWLARHGYVCLMVDTLQLGEIAAFHHGTYNLNRWWWHSRGYTPAGVEAWNGIRGIDYLMSRPDVDAERLAVTGISGGGAATFWVAAADERVKVAIPVSGMADLESYVPNRVINGHCDCMFLYNTFQWPWTRIAGLVAPRPMLFVNSDNDRIFPMDANERITNRLERLYSHFGRSGDFDTVVSVGGHAYRQDIREAVFRFLNMHLKGDSRPIADSEIDVVSEGGNPGPYPIAPERLRVFPTDADLPADQLNTKIDEHFVPIARPAPPEAGKFEDWKKPLLAELRRVSFSHFPREVPSARFSGRRELGTDAYTTEGQITITIRDANGVQGPGKQALLLIVLNADEGETTPAWVKEASLADHRIIRCEPRGSGDTKWTRKNGPNYVERSHALLGRTVDAGRVWDVIATAKHLSDGGKVPVYVAGKGSAGVIATYAAALDDGIAGATLVSPLKTHMENAAPQFLNVLRVCDVPDALGLVAPRPLTLVGVSVDDFAATKAAYEAAGASERLTFK